MSLAFLASPWLLAAGVGLSVVGSLASASQQAAIAKSNAALAQAEGQQAKLAAEQEEKDHRERVRRFLSGTRAAIAKSGVTLDGSALELMAESAAEAEYDALKIRHAGSLAQLRAEREAAQSRMQARAYRVGGLFGAGTTLLTGASTVAQQLAKVPLATSYAGAAPKTVYPWDAY